MSFPAAGDQLAKLLNRGNELASKGQYRRALESYDKILAKAPTHLAALTNRWPHLLNALGAPGSPTGEPDGGRHSVFEDLEAAADGPEDTWSELLVAHGLAGGGGDGRKGEPEGLRDFLKGGPRVGSLARELL